MNSNRHRSNLSHLSFSIEGEEEDFEGQAGESLSPPRPQEEGRGGQRPRVRSQPRVFRGLGQTPGREEGGQGMGRPGTGLRRPSQALGTHREQAKKADFSKNDNEPSSNSPQSRKDSIESANKASVAFEDHKNFLQDRIGMLVSVGLFLVVTMAFHLSTIDNELFVSVPFGFQIIFNLLRGPLKLRINSSQKVKPVSEELISSRVQRTRSQETRLGLHSSENLVEPQTPKSVISIISILTYLVKNLADVTALTFFLVSIYRKQSTYLHWGSLALIISTISLLADCWVGARRFRKQRNNTASFSSLWASFKLIQTFWAIIGSLTRLQISLYLFQSIILTPGLKDPNYSANNSEAGQSSSEIKIYLEGKPVFLSIPYIILFMISAVFTFYSIKKVLFSKVQLQSQNSVESSEADSVRRARGKNLTKKEKNLSPTQWLLMKHLTSLGLVAQITWSFLLLLLYLLQLQGVLLKQDQDITSLAIILGVATVEFLCIIWVCCNFSMVQIFLTKGLETSSSGTHGKIRPAFKERNSSRVNLKAFSQSSRGLISGPIVDQEQEHSERSISRTGKEKWNQPSSILTGRTERRVSKKLDSTKNNFSCTNEGLNSSSRILRSSNHGTVEYQIPVISHDSSRISEESVSNYSQPVLRQEVDQPEDNSAHEEFKSAFRPVGFSGYAEESIRKLEGLKRLREENTKKKTQNNGKQDSEAVIDSPSRACTSGQVVLNQYKQSDFSSELTPSEESQKSKKEEDESSDSIEESSSEESTTFVARQSSQRFIPLSQQQLDKLIIKPNFQTKPKQSKDKLKIVKVKNAIMAIEGSQSLGEEVNSNEPEGQPATNQKKTKSPKKKPVLPVEVMGNESPSNLDIHSPCRLFEDGKLDPNECKDCDPKDKNQEEEMSYAKKVEVTLKVMDILEKRNIPSQSVPTCSLCCEKPCDTVFQPCGHTGICFDCFMVMIEHSNAKCVFCRESISKVYKIDILKNYKEVFKILECFKIESEES